MPVIATLVAGEGVIIYRDIHYPPAGATRRLHIYLPQGYDSSAERYPVMYFFDGHNLFFDGHATYGKSWGLADFLDSWEKRVIVVGMECSHEGNARLDEYSPYRGRLLGHDIEPMGEQTFQWIIDDVKPLVDGWLRTWPHREATGIAGSSMGGLMSAYGVIRHNDVFGKAAALSTGLRWTGAHLARDLDRFVLNPDTRVWLSWGEHEAGGVCAGEDPSVGSQEARATHRMAGALRRRGALTRVHYHAGGTHSEASWEQVVPAFMDYLWLDR